MTHHNLIQLIKEKPEYLWIQIFWLSFVATLGTFYYTYYGDPFSNLVSGNLLPVGKGLVPCELCWYARVCMYPITLISAIGIATNDKTFLKYTTPLAVIGSLLGIYQYAMQMRPDLISSVCSLGVDCSKIDVIYFGFITLPLMSAVVFGLIAVLGVVGLKISTNKPN